MFFHRPSKLLIGSVILAMLLCAGLIVLSIFVKTYGRHGPPPPEFVTDRSLWFWLSSADIRANRFVEIINSPDYFNNREMVYDEMRAIIEEAGLTAHDWDNPDASIEAKYWSSARNRPVDGWGRPLMLIINMRFGIIAIASRGENGEWEQGFGDDKIELVSNRYILDYPR